MMMMMMIMIMDDSMINEYVVMHVWCCLCVNLHAALRIEKVRVLNVYPKMKN